MSHRVLLPYRKSNDSQHDDMPFHWLCWSRSEKTLKGDFTYEPFFPIMPHVASDDPLSPVIKRTVSSGTEITFTEEEDMQLFILMWGEYL